MVVEVKKVAAGKKQYALYTPNKAAKYGVFSDGRQVAVISARPFHAGTFTWDVALPSGEVIYTAGLLRHCKRFALERFA